MVCLSTTTPRPVSCAGTFEGLFCTLQVTTRFQVPPLQLIPQAVFQKIIFRGRHGKCRLELQTRDSGVAHHRCHLGLEQVQSRSTIARIPTGPLPKAFDCPTNFSDILLFLPTRQRAVGLAQTSKTSKGREKMTLPHEIHVTGELSEIGHADGRKLHCTLQLTKEKGNNQLLVTCYGDAQYILQFRLVGSVIKESNRIHQTHDAPDKICAWLQKRQIDVVFAHLQSLRKLHNLALHSF
mmetsp:Transcript_18458/g.42731  ORF Transcript_18458/g.42731 Transcript_18458/m.42731 type:complete len:238 (-) Transcript_18458:325-1038(-)